MKSAAISCLVGAAACVVMCTSSWTKAIRLDHIIDTIEIAGPLEPDKGLEAISLLLPESNKKEAALALLRVRHNAAKTYYSAWLEAAKTLQRSAVTQGVVALLMAVMFLGVFGEIRRDRRMD